MTIEIRSQGQGQGTTASTGSAVTTASTTGCDLGVADLPRGGPGYARRLGDAVVAAVLRSPAHRLLSGRFLLLTYDGRRTGRHYTLPVRYAPHGRHLVVVPARDPTKQWWRNLRKRAPIETVLRGSVRHGHGEVLGESAAAFPLATYMLRFPRAARTLVDQPLVVDLDLVEDHPSAA